MPRRYGSKITVISMETGEILRIEKPVPAKRKPKRRRRNAHRHKWGYQGRAGIFDSSKVYICEICGRRIVRTPRKPKENTPLAR